MPYKKIGRIVQALGLNGRVVLFDELPASKSLLQLDHFFIELQHGSYIPFFPEERPALMEEGKTAWLLDEINSSEEAKTLVGKDVYIEAEIFIKLFPSRSSMDEDLVGFLIKDKNSGNSGIIEAVIDAPGQLLANVIFQGKEILIPMAESFLITIDLPKKMIEMKLPEGIWEL